MSGVLVPGRLGRFLNLLDNVRRYGKGYRATCPNCGGSSKDALSACESDDGLILIHCFKGCPTDKVLASVGLRFSDIMPDRVQHYTSDKQLRQLQREARWAQWEAALDTLISDGRIIAVAASQIRRGKALDDEDQATLVQAIERLEDARGVLRG